MKSISTIQQSMKHISADIAKIMLPTLHKHGMTYFNYIKHYSDGRAIMLTTNAKVTDMVFKKNYFKTTLMVPKSYLQNEVNYYIWLHNDFPEVLIDSARNFDVANGITIAKKNADFIEYFGFATKNSNSSIINNFYLSNMDLLDKYTIHFKQKADKIIERFEINNLFLSCPINYDNQKIPSFKLTERQYECIALLSKGLSLKEIGKILNVSPRTIETHINALKLKFSCQNRIELITYFIRNLNSPSIAGFNCGGM